MSRFRPVFTLIILATTATGSGIVALPLDFGEWLSTGLAAWINQELGSERQFDEIVSRDIAAGDLIEMNRAAALLDLDLLLVVNCSYLDARVLTELFLFDTDGAELTGYWRGLLNYDALTVELQACLAQVFGCLATDFPVHDEALQLLKERWEDYIRVLDQRWKINYKI